MLTILAALLLCFDDLTDEVFEDDSIRTPEQIEKICPECGIDHDEEKMYEGIEFPYKSYQFGLDDD